MTLNTKLVLALAVLAGVRANAQVEREAYIELTEAQMLRAVDVNQSKTLMDLERVEAGAILGVDIADLTRALENQRSIPNEVNYTYRNSQGQMVTSQNGFLCGVRLVDVVDQDQRESEIMDRRDLCVSLKVFREGSAVMDGNAPMIKAAVEEAQSGAAPRLLIAAVNQSSKSMVAETAGDLLNPLVEFVAGGSGFVKPLDGSLIARSEFGMRKHPVYKKKRLHKGIDLRAASGSTVRAALKGRVLALRTERSKKGKIKGYGHYVILVHPDKRMQTLYAHLSSFKTKSGVNVAAGERIALSGATGVGTGPHLHFETHEGTTAVNPRKYISKLLSSLGEMIEKYFAIA